MIRTIFRKEILDTLRDRRTLMTMIVIPTFVFPIIMTLFIKVSDSFSKEAASKTIHIGLVNPQSDFSEVILNTLHSNNEKIIPFSDSIKLKEQIKSDSIQFGIFVPVNYNQEQKENKSSAISVFYNATEMGMKERAEIILAQVSEKLKNERLIKRNIDPTSIVPIELDYKNVASDKETFGKLAGGFLPYLFIVFGFVGCMYPAIDLFTGEKERGTLETLLTTPVSRWQILIGKMSVIVLSGILAASFTLLGIFLSISVFDIVKDPRLLEIIYQILSLKFILTLYLMLIPLIIFFAGVLIPITIYAKSFKEAQSIITPLNFIIILPAMVGFFPGIELNYTTACIPIVNIVLASKELIAGTLEFKYLFISFSVMVLIAGLAVALSYKRFDKESNLVS